MEVLFYGKTVIISNHQKAAEGKTAAASVFFHRYGVFRLLDQTHRLGFKRPADYVIYISGGPAFEGAISQIYQSQLSVRLMPVKTLMNQINRGIDVENNTQQLLREVDGLCQDFK